MILILSAMLLLTLVGSLSLNKEDKPADQEEEEEQTVEPVESDVIPSTFKGTISDEFSVPAEAMKVITDYMDAYYRSLYTLEVSDVSSLFDNEKMAAVSDRAFSLLVETHKNYDFDFRMNKAHYDLKVTAYEDNGNTCKIDLLEDDTMCFVFLNGIESKTFDVENYFTLSKKDGVYKISDLEKVQGYYLTFYDEAESIEKIDEVYDYFSRQLSDMHDYNNEVD